MLYLWKIKCFVNWSKISKMETFDTDNAIKKFLTQNGEKISLELIFIYNSIFLNSFQKMYTKIYILLTGNNLWPEFLKFLFDLASSPQPQHKETSLLLFRYVPSVRVAKVVADHDSLQTQ